MALVSLLSYGMFFWGRVTQIDDAILSLGLNIWFADALLMFSYLSLNPLTTVLLF